MTEQETAQVLILLYTEVGKELPPMKIKIWSELLKPVPYPLGMMAAKRMIKETRIFGEPQFHDYRAHVNFLHREAKRSLKPRKALCAAAMAYMDADERQAYSDAQRPLEITTAEAKVILDALKLQAKELPTAAKHLRIAKDVA